MKTNMGIEFWKKTFLKKNELNEVGRDLLNILVRERPDRALEYMLDRFNADYYREEIIEMFSEKYTKDKINMILEDLDDEELQTSEIIDFNIENEETENVEI